MSITATCAVILSSTTTSHIHGNSYTTQTLSTTTKVVCIEQLSNSTLTVTNNSSFVDYGDGLISLLVVVGIITIAVALLRAMTRR